ncbi:hypothetical protein KIW84_024943 [Lathyrus oleraceus]|uniref:Uncharacterized protein n=1 Tax=Pisum sativum TaxID=3888 RepID=A0A9D5BD69_PEA|nr:hypothetical protein KIW84_024943 [Pisum sativum]
MMAREVEADKRKVASASTPPPVDVLQENYVNLSQQYEDENHSGMVQESKPAAHPAATIGETRAEDKYKTLEERLKIIENGLKRGKIKKSSSGQHNNKKYPNNSNSKKVDVNVVTIDGYSQGPYPYVATVNPNQYPQLAYFKHRDQQPISPPP